MFLNPLIAAAFALTSGLVKALPLPQEANNKVAAAWYAGWHADSSPAFPLSQVSWSKYTHLTFAFAEPTLDVNTLYMDGSNQDLLPEFVGTAHDHGVKALVSIGGATGSRWWSNNVDSEERRVAFVNTIINFVQQYNLDGIDFDWELPGIRLDGGSNTVSPQDTANFLQFLRLLREHPIGSNLILTTATSIGPFFGEDGNPSTDVSEFSWCLDYIQIMNYDVWGNWGSVVRPNAPLDDTCTSEDRQGGSAVSALKAWSDAGMPYDKIVLGVASYGHSFLVSEEVAYQDKSINRLSAYPPFYSTPVGDAWGGAEGIVDYWSLVTEGYVDEDGSPREGMGHRHDLCSQTPYVYNPATEIMVSYDDPRSFSAKGAFIQRIGLRGFAMWEAGGDYQDRLLDSIRESAGF
ncbi:endochitinase [Cyathus striatus]|nr:endochitinase [Cyathus striatus]